MFWLIQELIQWLKSKKKTWWKVSWALAVSKWKSGPRSTWIPEAFWTTVWPKCLDLRVLTGVGTPEGPNALKCFLPLAPQTAQMAWSWSGLVMLISSLILLSTSFSQQSNNRWRDGAFLSNYLHVIFLINHVNKPVKRLLYEKWAQTLGAYFSKWAIVFAPQPLLLNVH